MPDHQFKMPPLEWIRTFEAAARCGSFTAAAAETGLTQSAISQRIGYLEKQLGVTLFYRRVRAIELTVEGEAWHTAPKSDVPENFTLVPLPPRSPKLNPVENVWQFIRDNWFSNCVFENYDDIVAPCGQAWNKLIDQPDRITSIGSREWANRF